MYLAEVQEEASRVVMEVATTDSLKCFGRIVQMDIVLIAKKFGDRLGFMEMSPGTTTLLSGEDVTPLAWGKLCAFLHVFLSRFRWLVSNKGTLARW